MNHTGTSIGSDIEAAKQWLTQSLPVAIPTETVYGLAANALDASAVLRIYETKDRPRFNPLILHVSSLTEVEKWSLSFPNEARKLAEAFWPGPLTLLLPKSALISDIVTAGSDRVAIRVPAHPLTKVLLENLSFPLVAPSANPSGYVSPTNAQHVYEGLKGKIPYILDGGPCMVGLESTIIGWNEDNQAVIHRAGGLALENIQEVLGYAPMFHQQEKSLPQTPGQLKSHYAPHSPLYREEPDPQFYAQEGIFLIRFQTFHPAFPEEQQRILSVNGSLEEAAQQLFHTLREVDQLQPSRIYAEKVPEKGLGIAINDRLERAKHIWK